MFIMIKHTSGVCSVLDTTDGVVERVSTSQLRNYISIGVNIVGVSIRPEFGDGQDMFLDSEASRRALVGCGISPSTYGL